MTEEQARDAPARGKGTWRRLGRWLLRGALSLVLVGLLGFAGFVGWLHLHYGRLTAANVDYLKTHVVGQGPVAGPLELTLPPALLRQSLILLSEIHGSAAPQTLDLALLKELNAKTGLTHYVAEVDPAQAATLNAYLQTGDEAGLRAVFDLWTPDAQWGNRDFENKVRAIRAYDQTLPTERRVRFVGLDAVQDFPFAAAWIARTTGLPAEPAFLRGLGDRKRSEAAQAILAWCQGHAALRAEDQPDLDALGFSLGQSAAGKFTRDTVIFGNYRYQVEHGVLRDAPAYGLWGMFHGLQGQGAEGAAPFAAQVRRSDLAAAHGLATIFCVGVDSKMMVPTSALPPPLRPRGVSSRTTDFGADGPLLYLLGAADLKGAAPAADRLTLFQLDAEGSPYLHALALGPHWSLFGAIPFDQAGAATTDYFQYLAFYRGSPAVAPRAVGE